MILWKMEHYILCISLESILEENQRLVQNYLESLVPSSHQYQCSVHFTSQLSFLLKSNNVYTKTVSRNPNVKIQDLLWQGPTSHANFKILHENITQDVATETETDDHFEQLCESIHTLVDLLPAFGTYKFDVLLSSDVLKNKSVSEEPLLASTFYRLVRWHAAHFAICIQSEVDKLKFSEWCEIINADILNENNECLFGPSIWRGSILLQDAKGAEAMSLEGLEFKLDSKENEDSLSVLQHLNQDIVMEPAEHVVVSSKMIVIDQCSFSSIPPYMISPMVFRLHLCQANILNESSSDFLNYLLNNNEVALILRLGYVKMKERTKSEKKYCTNRWKKAVSTASIRNADTFISNYEDFITFVLTKSKVTNNVVAFPLREAKCLDPAFYFAFINYKESLLSCYNAADEVANDTDKNALSNMPLIQDSLFHEAIQKINSFNLEVYKSGNFTHGSKISSELSSFWKEIQSFSKQKISNTEDIDNDIALEELDPSDWPERVHLLLKQIQIEENKGTAPNALLGLGPKLPILCVSFTSEDVKKYFLPSGETKNPTNAEIILPLNNLNLSTHDLEVVLNSKWPAVLNHLYHDLYYNSSHQAEEKETVGNQMVNFYVKHDTASTCNKQQILQNLPIVIQGKSSPSSKEFRSPSCRKPTKATNKNAEEKENKDCKENLVRDLITKKILSTSRSSQNTSKTDFSNKTKADIQISVGKGVKRKCEAPTRCSPRKKNPVNYNYPSQRNPESSKSTKVINSNQKLDLIKKKLRHAVAAALENNGIHLKHPFFQPCGKKLFTICQAFVQDIPQKGKTSEHLQKIADAHVKQVIEFERQKHEK